MLTSSGKSASSSAGMNSFTSTPYADPSLLLDRRSEHRAALSVARSCARRALLRRSLSKRLIVKAALEIQTARFLWTSRLTGAVASHAGGDGTAGRVGTGVVTSRK